MHKKVLKTYLKAMMYNCPSVLLFSVCRSGACHAGIKFNAEMWYRDTNVCDEPINFENCLHKSTHYKSLWKVLTAHARVNPATPNLVPV